MKTVTLTEEQWALVINHLHAYVELHLTEGDMEESEVEQIENIALNIEAQVA